MAEKLVEPIYYVYKLTFVSGRTYVGMHKQTFVEDSYITSSSYYSKHSKDDPLLKREILVQSNDEFAMSFLETWCILSDKAYNKDTNVNYNLGNFFHRFSTGFHTPEEIAASIEKRRLTIANRTPEQRAAIGAKISTNVKNWWESMSEEDFFAYKQRMSENAKRYWSSLSEEDLFAYKQRMSEVGKRHWSLMTDEQRADFSNKQKERILNWWKYLSEEDLAAYKQKMSKTSKAYFDRMRTLYDSGFSPEIREKIKKRIRDYFDNLSDEDHEIMANKARNVWNNLSQKERNEASEKMRASWAAKTYEEKRAIQDKVLETKGLSRVDRTPRTKEQRSEAWKKTWHSKSEEEIAEWKKKFVAGNMKHFEENRKLYGTGLTPEARAKISKAHMGQKLSDETRKKLGEKNKERFAKMTKEEHDAFVQKCRDSSSNAKKVQCVETGEVFNSLTAAAAWVGNCCLRSRIRECADGHASKAGNHPITKEPLHWEWIISPSLNRMFHNVQLVN